jgi:hypothetical protein
MKDGQTAYRQGFKAVPNIYFVLYGKFDYKVWEEVKNNDTETSGTEGPSKVVSPDGTKQQVSFGERCGLGWTIGEEILFNDKDHEEIM